MNSAMLVLFGFFVGYVGRYIIGRLELGRVELEKAKADLCAVAYRKLTQLLVALCNAHAQNSYLWFRIRERAEAAAVEEKDHDALHSLVLSIYGTANKPLDESVTED